LLKKDFKGYNFGYFLAQRAGNSAGESNGASQLPFQQGSCLSLDGKGIVPEPVSGKKRV